MSMNYITQALCKSSRRFAREESGMTLPTLALTLMALSGFIGTSVDIARLQLVQSKLSFALDAAGLAAGATLNTTDLDGELAKYMNANFPAKYMGSTVPQIVSETSTDKMVIDVTATTVMPTTFMSILGISEMTVVAKSEITRTSSGLELVMALDNTGSMAGTRLTSLKSAATSLVNILYGTKATVPDLYIGLVPFSQSVNIGNTRSTWIDQTDFATLVWGPTSWGGCVDARETSSGDTVDTPPTEQKYKAYYSKSTDNRAYPYNTYTYTSVNPWVTSRDWQGKPLTFNVTSSKSPNVYCPQQVTPMTGDKTTILNGINSMTAQGNTHVNLGAIWGWNMLSPRWRGLWGGDMDTNALPLDYGTKHMNKAVILLTDGENTMSQSIFTAYGYLSDGRLGSTSNSSTAVTTLNTKLTTVCTAMKQKGIYVYTIVFGSPGTTIQNLMKGCATSENYFFLSPTTAELTTVFNAIADSLSNLRISQ